ncbi:hypothetical protein PG994_005546 [Apiospora phragmitis]|uniref:MYND-type domain-containing protein n=1 Tax=Apiospora phragmitis TaxID=2905665 RepID=A0ABR1VFB5_9PEZI
MDVATRRKMAIERAKQPGKDYCGGCKTALYCSRECQVKDHPHHKTLCKTYDGFTDGKRPSESHVRGILFPAGEKKPKLVWCEQKVSKGKTTIYADKHIGRYRITFGVSSVNQHLKLIGREDIGHGLVTICESDSPVPGCPLNKSYMALGEPAHLIPRFGNLLFLATMADPDCNEGKNVVLSDTDFRDFRHALDSLQMYEMNFAAGPPERLATLTKAVATMPALLIHGDGSLARWTAVAYTDPHQVSRMQKVVTRVSVPLMTNNDDGHQAIEQDQAVGPRQVGLEWFFRCYAMGAHGWAAADVNPATLRNDAACHLFKRAPRYNLDRNRRNNLVLLEERDKPRSNVIVVDPNEEYHLQRIYPQLGTIMLLEKSGAVIEPEHVEVLNLFLDSVARYNPGTRYPDEFIDENELWVGPEKRGKDEASKAFKQFWDDWKREQEAKGISVEHLRSPYELKGDVNPTKVMVTTILNKVQRGAEAVDQAASEQGIVLTQRK